MMQPPTPTNTPGSIPASLVVGSDFYIHPPAPSSSRPATTSSVSAIDSEPAASEITEEQGVAPTSYFRFKHQFERVVTAALMMLAIPIMMIVALAVLICDGRPVTFRQVRVGRDGRLFRIWKFRTMRCGAEDRTGAVWSSASDTRITRLGRWLRCSHLDELPQFINVLCGDMNLVGPRPERPEFVETLVKEVPGYMQRSQVRPGITGLAQLRLGYDESIAGIPEKLDCDLEYICQASLTGDAVLLTKTLPHIAMQLHERWITRCNPVSPWQKSGSANSGKKRTRKQRVDQREQTLSLQNVKAKPLSISRGSLCEGDVA